MLLYWLVDSYSYLYLYFREVRRNLAADEQEVTFSDE
jgi:hypothetical protein